MDQAFQMHSKIGSNMDTANDNLIAIDGDGNIVSLIRQFKMSKEEALRMAAWIVALADSKDEFPEILAAVENT